MFSIILYYIFFYIHQKNHILYLLRNIHDFLLIKKNFLDILSYKRIKYILFQLIVFLYLHNHLKIDNFYLGDTPLFQIIAKDHKIDRVYHHIYLIRGQALIILVVIKIFFLIQYINILFHLLINLFLCLVLISTIFYYKNIITFSKLIFFVECYQYQIQVIFL